MFLKHLFLFQPWIWRKKSVVFRIFYCCKNETRHEGSEGSSETISHCENGLSTFNLEYNFTAK